MPNLYFKSIKTRTKFTNDKRITDEKISQKTVTKIQKISDTNWPQPESTTRYSPRNMVFFNRRSIEA